MPCNIKEDSNAVKRTNKMKQEERSELTEQELKDKAKKKRSTAIINAILIGFLVGIIIYSAVNNRLGFFTLIPLFFIYKLTNRSKDK
jgi:F0F1-type ATP synthase assembly protein I